MLVTRLLSRQLGCCKRLYCSGLDTGVDPNTYLKLSEETLESLEDRFSELIDDHGSALPGADTALADGVLTVKLKQGVTYVINKQTPNKQIWLSSPVSGPYRYDIFRVRHKIFSDLQCA